jgi:predicted transcriptional regulator
MKPPELLKTLAVETHQNVSSLLTEAIREYVAREHLQPVALNHLEQSIAENEALEGLLAK